MASPLATTKQSINLTPSGVPGSRIRRNPPSPEKKTLIPDRNERDRRTVAIGIALSALLLVVILAGFASYSGWSPREVTAHL
ncbi:hypothetical protein G7076_10095 [Sphingomonas sp. HDW15A]|uniref:hypothetical protein n=1 Tax=Sphingomonas sp. HDW15A TaxID=2714942 RepID=UPI0014073F04|nr:hypothetical protein [Sphingomonas sp. HDW15A]QIK96740.1 hypothetical protein G7076_10095 [Sphingomonas sp. HDW15A]